MHSQGWNEAASDAKLGYNPWLIRGFVSVKQPEIGLVATVNMIIE
jgi:hypothetical protein